MEIEHNMQPSFHIPIRRLQRAFSTDITITLIIFATIFAVGGYWLYHKYTAPQQAGNPPYISQPPPIPEDTLSDDEVLQRLLTAVDRRDYATIEVYAISLFAERSDIDLELAINGLRDPVLRAAINGDVQLFNALVVAKPAFGGFDERGRRPIHLAASGDHHEAVKWLIEHVGADINDPIVGTRLTPLHLAVSEGATATIRFLVENNADLLATSAKGQTPLHYAVARGNHTGASELLDATGSQSMKNGIGAQDTNGDTPLHIAARKGDYATALALLSAGASKAILNNANQNPHDVAYTSGHDELATKLDP